MIHKDSGIPLLKNFTNPDFLALTAELPGTADPRMYKALLCDLHLDPNINTFNSLDHLKCCDVMENLESPSHPTAWLQMLQVKHLGAQKMFLPCFFHQHHFEAP